MFSLQSSLDSRRRPMSPSSCEQCRSPLASLVSAPPSRSCSAIASIAKAILTKRVPSFLALLGDMFSYSVSLSGLLAGIAVDRIHDARKLAVQISQQNLLD